MACTATMLRLSTRIRVILFLFAICTTGYAQLSLQDDLISVAPETLANSFVRCFHKDSKGFMWLGTSDGLLRYDGTNIKRYEHSPEDPESICHNNINVIREDKQHRLWVGTSVGLCIYHPDQDAFVTLDSLPGIKNHLNNRYITDLAFDKQEKVWIGTYGNGVNVFDPSTLTFTYLNDDRGIALRIPTNYVSAVQFINDFLWCGTKGGLKLFDTRTMREEKLTFVGDQFPDKQITQILQDSHGNIWISALSGEIMKVIPGNGYYTHKLIFEGQSAYGASWANILTMCFDKNGRLLIAGENSGLNYLDPKSGKVTRVMSEGRNPVVLPTNSIRNIYISADGLIWLGTFNKGAHLIDHRPHNFKSYKWPAGQVGTNQKDVKGFAEDRDGNIWVALDGAGLGRLDGKSKKLNLCKEINARINNKFITSLICDRNNNLWIGTRGSGIYKIEIKSLLIHNYKVTSNSFGDDKIYCLYEDKKGRIWAGTYGSGVFCFNEHQQRFNVLLEESKATNIPRTSYVSSILQDSEGSLWVGTMYGLYELRETSELQFDYKLYLQGNNKLGSSGIQSLLEDKDKRIWIGTVDNGVNIRGVGETEFRSVQRKDGILSNTIRSLIADAAGNVWISTNMGLSKFEQHTGKFLNYTHEDGLTSNDFYPNSSLRSSDGEMFFGSNNSFNSFLPDSIFSSTDKPQVLLTELKINNQAVSVAEADSPLKKSITFTNDIHLAYDQRSFTIDFVALDYGHPAHHRYSYKLEGFDTDWNTTDGRSATYTNLDPGQYTFLVKAVTNDAVWSAEPTRLTVEIEQSIWKTWWMTTLYILVVVGIAYLFLRIRLERLKMRNQLEFERLAREQEHALSESKTQFFTNVSHELRTPLSLMLMPLETLLSVEQLAPSAKERVLTAYNSAGKLMHLVNELMDFSKIESGNLNLNPKHGDAVSFVSNTASIFNDLAEKKNIRFTVDARASTIHGWFDPDKLEKIIVNLLSNAFKFTCEGGRIDLVIEEIQRAMNSDPGPVRCLQLVVSDNGIGISPEEMPKIFDKFYQAKSASKVANPGTGIGLSLAKSLVELHKGTINAESEAGGDTKFTLVIPLGEATKNAGVGQHEDDVVLKVVRDAQQPAKKTSDKAEVLIVEDNDELRKYLADELQVKYKVIVAADGAQALSLALERSPDLIISDVLMPNLSGIDLCKEIKTDVKTSHIPFILLTARASVEDQVLGIETGADVYITKPFSVRVLVSHVNNIIESRQRLYAHFSHDVYLLPSRMATNKIDETFLKRAVDYVLANIQDSQLSADTMAAEFNLSRVQMYRKIKALTGKTIVEFIRSIRLKEALRLMEAKELTLAEIAFATGFNSASYFTRTFKDEYGKAPSEYLAVGS